MPTAHTTKVEPAKGATAHANASGSAPLSATAQRTASGRKVRGDARDQLLTPEQQLQLQSICAAAGPQNRVNAFLVECGLKPVAKGNQSDIWHRYNKAAEDMGFDVRTMRLLQEMANVRGETVEKMLGQFSLVEVQKLMAAARAKTPEESADLILQCRASFNEAERTVIMGDRNDISREKIQQDHERLEFARQTKVEAGLKQIEKEVGRNAQIKAAVEQIRAAMKEAA